MATKEEIESRGITADPLKVSYGLRKSGYSLRQHQGRLAGAKHRLLDREEAKRVGYGDDEIEEWFGPTPAEA